MGLLDKLFDDNAKDIKRYSKILQGVNALEPEIQKLSDAELRNRTSDFRLRLQNGEELDALLPEAFATVREAGWRVLNMRHFDVQLIGGMVLSDGRVAEMKTGEGKTLVATAPTYLHALTGKGAHVITVNDYLARRDSEWMGRIYKFLGLTVGLCVHGMEPPEKREAYLADITYGTNNEFGFDYLRDNMAFSKAGMVQRPLYYAIVDEVDSILIDEARTPLIISGPADKPTVLYEQAAQFVPRLKREDDYTVDEKTRQSALTEEGVAKAERAFGVENLYDDKNMEISHHINQALRAHTLYKRDRDYVVKEGQVIIVDEFTGRLMFGRRYSEGLHQAIEAKEHVKVERESQTLATITFQNFFRMYDRLAGMTGTARTEEEEFRKIYGFDVVEVPTNLPMIRSDNSDIIYRSEPGKFAAVVEEIAAEHEKGRPVLVGTISIEKSERLSRMLKDRGVRHNVLNAKFHEQEAEIVAQAGRLGAVTIATNMAGRGTDIMLGGNPEALAAAEMAAAQAADAEREFSDEERLQLINKYKESTADEHKQVVELGGLHIIGTERHDSRRIDNQLRGRAGRQGDPGSSRFFISLEDDLVRHFGGDNIRNIMDRIGMDDTMPIDSGLVSRSIEGAQKKVEERHFEMRRQVLNYDDVMNQQREVIYKERRRALYEENIHESVLSMMENVVDVMVAPYTGMSEYPEEWDLSALTGEFAKLLPQDAPKESELAALGKNEVPEQLKERILNYYHRREEALGKEIMARLENMAILRAVDSQWMDHLDAMDQLRQGIGLRAYGQIDPLVEYRNEAFNMFQQMIEEIQLDVTRLVLHAEIVEAPRARAAVSTNREEDEPAKKQPVRRDAKSQVGRNDPCPCGSGKKYKKCCGRGSE
ncbi:MAG: preprotein translocase subunit SecA [Clostridiales bacterium]|nr:preprotein translocase subunit SecA [Clostridiales bacterium]